MSKLRELVRIGNEENLNFYLESIGIAKFIADLKEFDSERDFQKQIVEITKERSATIRDQFAMAALPSIYKDNVAQCENIGSFPEKWRNGIAEDVYLMADAMLEVRNVDQEEK